MEYFWQHKEFPDFQFNIEDFMEQIQEFAIQLGEANGLYQNVSDEDKIEVQLQITLSEALKTSEIEGEYFSREDIMSSLQKQLGVNDFHIPSKDKKAQAISELMLQVRKDYQIPLSLTMLKEWHATLMKYDKGVTEGEWRSSTESMQIVSGRYGAIEVHYEAPPAKEIPQLMQQFELWYQNFPFQNIGVVGRAMLRSALVHLYFETLHPFEDGNGRIGRALSEKVLAETLEKPVLISISKSIEAKKQEYYEKLKETQRSQNVTKWLQFFFKVLIEAQTEIKETVLYVVQKAKFFDKFKSKLNERQQKVLHKMVEKGKDGFVGGMTAKKYISITKTSKATATRDLQDLVKIGALINEGAGRSVRYELNIK